MRYAVSHEGRRLERETRRRFEERRQRVYKHLSQ